MRLEKRALANSLRSAFEAKEPTRTHKTGSNRRLQSREEEGEQNKRETSKQKELGKVLPLLKEKRMSGRRESTCQG